MPLLFCGSNVFDQFKLVTPASFLCNFEPLTVDGIVPQQHVLVASTFSYVAFAIDRILVLQGVLGEVTNATHKAQATHKILQIAANDKFVLILLENGDLFKLLPQIEAKLQQIQLDVLLEAQKVPLKRNIFGVVKEENVECKKPIITHIACGDTITVAMDNENRIYNIPSEIHRFPSNFKLKQLVCGFEHALLLNTNGDIYAWGTGLRGQLGKEDLDTEETPMLVEALAGIKITHIAAGGWHSAAVSAFGDLYVWGFNSDGQLGLCAVLTNEAKVFPLPQLVEMPKCLCGAEQLNEECFPIKIFAGARHLVVIKQCRAVFAAGRNFHGQLSLKDKKNCKAVDLFAPVDTKDAPLDFEISCGHWNTFIQWHNKNDKSNDNDNNIRL